MRDAHVPDTDRAILEAVRDACSAEGLEPALIGAAALAIGLRTRCASSLPRSTRDWDFAVEVGDRAVFESLARRLVDLHGLQRANELHRFRSKQGAVVDLVPYARAGDVVEGMQLEVPGFVSLSKDLYTFEVAPGLEFEVAGLHMLVGLKLLAYRDRRPAVRRDIVDVDHVLQVIPWDLGRSSMPARAEQELSAGRLDFGSLAAFVVGLELTNLFSAECAVEMLRLAREAADPWSAANRDASRNELGTCDDGVRRAVAERFDALARGLEG